MLNSKDAKQHTEMAKWIVPLETKLLWIKLLWTWRKPENALLSRELKGLVNDVGRGGLGPGKGGTRSGVFFPGASWDYIMGDRATLLWGMEILFRGQACFCLIELYLTYNVIFVSRTHHHDSIFVDIVKWSHLPPYLHTFFILMMRTFMICCLSSFQRCNILNYSPHAVHP